MGPYICLSFLFVLSRDFAELGADHCDRIGLRLRRNVLFDPVICTNIWSLETTEALIETSRDQGCRCVINWSPFFSTKPKFCRIQSSLPSGKQPGYHFLPCSVS